MEQSKTRFTRESSYEELSEKYAIMHFFASRYAKYHKALQPHMVKAGISSAGAHVLILLADAPGLTVTETARLMGCTSGAVTQIVDKLERAGLARREKQPGNAKAVHLYATPAGAQVAEQHRLYTSRHTAQLLDTIQDCTPEEINAFFKVMDRLGNFYGELLQPPTA